MASSHHFSPPCQVSARLAPLVWSSAIFLLSRWSTTPVCAASSSLKCRKYKVHFPVNMNVESSVIFADTVDAFKAAFTISTRPSSNGRSNATNRGKLHARQATGSHCGGSLDRTESVPKWSRERRARAGLRKASRRDKAVCLWSIHHSLCPKMQLLFYNQINSQLLIKFSDRVVRGEWYLIRNFNPLTKASCNTVYLVQQYLVNLNSHMFRRPPQEELI